MESSSVKIWFTREAFSFHRVFLDFFCLCWEFRVPGFGFLFTLRYEEDADDSNRETKVLLTGLLD